MSSPIEHRHLQQAMLRIDGVDVDQLLRDIGEASASSSPVDLFDLLLGAQRVLAAAGTSRVTPNEAVLLANYRSLNNYGRNSLIRLSEQYLKRLARTQPALTLVRGDQKGGTR